MKLINSSFEILDQEPGQCGIYKQIELAGRTCYKSEGKIGEGTAEKFTAMLINNGHLAMLEHGTVYLYDSIGITDVSALDKYQFNKFSNYNICQSNFNYDIFVTTNYRVIVENGWEEDLKYIVDKPLMGHESRYSVRFVCDRGVANEIVRHRGFSFAQESTRFCNYSKDKFGSELTFIRPSEYASWDDESKLIFIDSCRTAESHYLSLIKNDHKPQEARAVLPLSLKTEIVVTGTESQWRDMLRLRIAPNAHPDIRDIMIPLLQEFVKRNYITYDEPEN